MISSQSQAGGCLRLPCLQAAAVLLYLFMFALQGFAPNQFGSVDPFLMGVAGNVLQQQGSNYLQKGQAFMQSKMGFLSGGLLHYHFSVTGDYGMPSFLLRASPNLSGY